MSDAFTSGNGEQITSDPAAPISQLKQLNLDYLRLLVLEWRESPTLCAQLRLPSLSTEWLAALGSANDAGLNQLADSRFSLFALVFHNTELWRRMTFAGIADEMTQRYADSGQQTVDPNWRLFVSRRSGFMECALFYAWHVAHRDRAAARLQLGLRDDTTDVLLGLELWQIRRVALKYPQLLAPRWPENSCFWPDLLRYLQSGELQYFDYARLLGSQLLAQELEPSAIERLTSRRKNLFRPTSRRR